jgi:hypothetical protein
MKKYFLTTAILLLAAFANASGQNTTPKDSLVGLREVVLGVEYGQIDGLDAAQRPVMLQHLQDRAKEQLTKAEIPLLKTNDDDVAGRPHLVFAVTANKDTQNAPTVVVTTKLFEPVRLSRDATKEMKVATWIHDGVGVASRLSEKLLFDVFDSQLNGFIRAYREANPNLKPNESSAATSVAPLRDNANSLQGLEGVTVFASFRSDGRRETPERAALRQSLQTEAEARLIKAAIPVLKGNDPKAGQTTLTLVITLSPPLSDRHAIEVESKFFQYVQPMRDPQKQIWAVTWESQGQNGPPITDDAVRATVNQQLDEFIKAYTAANPKPAARP